MQGRIGTFNHQIETEDCSVGILTFENGAFGVIQTTTCSYPSLGTTIQINGSKGTITMDKSGGVDLLVRDNEITSIEQVEVKGTQSHRFKIRWHGGEVTEEWAAYLVPYEQERV